MTGDRRVAQARANGTGALRRPTRRGLKTAMTARGATSPDSTAASLQALQRTAGNRAVGVALQRALKNKADWDPVDPATGQGKRVVAIVGPGLKKGTIPGSTPGFRPYEYTRLFSAASKKAQYCQGHLLNEHLGGPGKPGDPQYGSEAAKNLTAFPQTPTNTDHKTVAEKLVKDAVTKKRWLKYEVEITYATDLAGKLRKRLGLTSTQFTTAYGTSTGIAGNASTFSYAAHMRASWQELDDTPASTNASPLVKAGGMSDIASFNIPSPLTYISEQKQKLEYPAPKAKGTYIHMKKFKGNQAWSKTAVAVRGRAYILPERWRGIEDARARKKADSAGNAVYQEGFTHYGEGVAAARAGTVASTRYGRGYNLGRADYDDGITHGRLNPLSVPPSYLGDKAGHADYWAGVSMAENTPLAKAPANNTGQRAGHADYWAGVDHGRGHSQTATPAGLAAAKGHTDYWQGAATVRAAPNAPKPASLAKAQGHADFLAGLSHARSGPRGTAPAMPSSVASAAITEYWQGVDHARNNAATVPCPVPGSAAAAGVADYGAGVTHAEMHVRGTAPPGHRSGTTLGAVDYWAGEAHAVISGTAPPGGSSTAVAAFTAYWRGAGHARASLANLWGPAPPGRVAARGFAAYRDGVAARQAGQPNNAMNPAFAFGWNEADAGERDARANAVNPLITWSGYLSLAQTTPPAVGKRRRDAADGGRSRRKPFH